MSALKTPETVTRAAALAAEAAAERTQVNVVLFSGGSGTHSITEALRRHPQINLKILINAYDDGHSTGRLRKFIPSMLGPSDVRKNINRLMPSSERCQKALKLLSDHRLPVGITQAEALPVLECLARGEHQRLPPNLAEAYRQLTIAQAGRFRSFLEHFLRYFEQQTPLGRTFDFTDCALGNLLFAGCYLEQGHDFNRAIQAFSIFYEVPPDVLLNVTLGENLFLVCEKEDGNFLLNEAAIVAAQSSARITRLYLLDEDTYRRHVENAASAPQGGWGSLIRAAACIPKLNPAVERALAEADVIIYGPGTQHSSLFPSYMTEGVAETIAANLRADKIFVGNIYRDHDIQQDDINDLARKFLDIMSRERAASVEWRDVVTQFFVQQAAHDSEKAKYVPFQPAQFPYPLDTIRLRDWEEQEGHHSGGFVVDEVRQIVQTRIDIALESVRHMVSIVIPVLNEEKTLETVLKEVLALDFQPLGLTKEVLVIDGGSSDRSPEIAGSMRGVKFKRLDQPLGRGAALRMGIENARGNIVAFFAADREYKVEDLYTIVASLADSRFRAVFGTRSPKVTNLSGQLKGIYQNNWGLYLVSKYGGMALSVLTLLLYNRYVSDILTSLKAFDAELLRSLPLKGSGRDLDTEIVAHLARRREWLYELPVDYSPRTRSQGKKITIGDGLSALYTLARLRFG